MLMRIIVCALVAGGIAGGVSAFLQQAMVVPLIHEAETYEVAGGGAHDANTHGDAHGSASHTGAAHDGTAAAHGDSAHATHAADHAESGGLARMLTTAVMTISVNVGFAFLLLAGFHARDARPGLQQGIIWGIAGFVAFMLAPAAGLAPELPGATAAPVAARQIWWAATAVSAAGGLWLIAFVRQPLAIAAAVALFAAPHLVGAPEAAGVGTAPPELAAMFAARALAVGLVGWAVLGAACAWAWDRQGAPARATA